MIQMILFSFVGALLFASLILFVLRSSRPEGGAEALVQARKALTQLQTALLPAEIVDRFCSSEDYEFVASIGSARVNSFFCRQRKKIVLAWIGQVRRQIKGLRRFHLGAARFYARLTFRSEVSLAIDFAILLIACRALQILVWIGGPRVAPRMVGATAAAGLRICEISGHALAFLAVPNPQAGRPIAF
ncbi:MAG: hypothetical protein ACRD4R_04125 [Candidatus Acidiferrales bacterium]